MRRALLYRKSATAAVVLHDVESDLYKHANGRRKTYPRQRARVSTPLAPLTRAVHKVRTRDNTAAYEIAHVMQSIKYMPISDKY